MTVFKKSYGVRNGARVQMERLTPSGMYLIELWEPNGSLFTKMRCDDFRDALAVFSEFKKQAKEFK